MENLEVEKQTWLNDKESVESKVTKRTVRYRGSGLRKSVRFMYPGNASVSKTLLKLCRVALRLRYRYRRQFVIEVGTNRLIRPYWHGDNIVGYSR